MSWSREQVEILIEQYKSYPCLYAVKSKDYKNKHARIRALESIQHAVQTVKPNVTIQDIKNKFQGLKTNFLVEFRKYEKSLKSGTGDDDIYQPTLWYFDIMDFVLEHTVPRPAIDNADTQNTTVISDDCEESQENDSELVDEMNEETEYVQTYEIQNDNTLQLVSPGTSVNSSRNSCLSSPAGSVKSQAPAKRKSASDDLVGETTGAIKALATILERKKVKKPATGPERDQFDVFGELVANKLRQLPQELADNAEEEILSLIYGAIKTKP